MVRTSSVRPLLDHLDQQGGAGAGSSLDRARALLHDPSALMPIATAGALFEEAERHCHREDIGFRAALATPPLEFGDWGAVIASSPTLGCFLTQMSLMSRRFNSGQQIWWERRGDEAWLHHRLCSQLVQGRRAVSEFSLGMILQGLRLAAGPEWRPLEIHLEGPPPSHAKLLASHAARQIHFEGPHTIVVLPLEVLARRFPVSAGAVRAISRAPLPADSFEGSIRQTVESLVRLRCPDLAVAAEAAHMSERSLQRRLGECGLRFAQLVEAARFDAARRLLQDPSVKIVEVSAELGYTDSANFTRAFRRWTGVAPQAFRRVG